MVRQVMGYLPDTPDKVRLQAGGRRREGEGPALLSGEA